MKKYAKASFIYMIIALASGVFYRELTKIMGFVGETRLSVMHVHYFVLGMVFFLLFALLEARTGFSKEKYGKAFFVFYTIGLNGTGLMLFIRGLTQVIFDTGTISRGLDMSISGLSGVAHTLLGAGLVLFFLALFRTKELKESE